MVAYRTGTRKEHHLKNYFSEHLSMVDLSLWQQETQLLVLQALGREELQEPTQMRKGSWHILRFAPFWQKEDGQKRQILMGTPTCTR